jgi:hypothetical protein
MLAMGAGNDCVSYRIYSQRRRLWTKVLTSDVQIWGGMRAIVIPGGEDGSRRSKQGAEAPVDMGGGIYEN